MNEIHALSGAYAVDALDEHERAMFEAHLEHCATCRAEVAEFRETVALLGQATAAPPPAGLRQAVLDGIGEIRPLPPLANQPPVDDDADEDDEDGAGTRSRRNPVLAVLAAAAALVAAVALAITQPWVDDPSQQPVPVAEQVRTATDAHEVSIEFPDGAVATVIHSAQVGHAIIETHDMPPAPEGHGYQLWLEVDDEMHSAGVMPPGENQIFVLEGEATDAVAAAISVEPDTGSPQPTTDPIAYFDFRDEAPQGPR